MSDRNVTRISLGIWGLHWSRCPHRNSRLARSSPRHRRWYQDSSPVCLICLSQHADSILPRGLLPRIRNVAICVHTCFTTGGRLLACCFSSLFQWEKKPKGWFLFGSIRSYIHSLKKITEVGCGVWRVCSGIFFWSFVMNLLLSYFI